MVISKERSTLIKGIVIIMMVFLHLFNGDHTELCTNSLYVGGEPFAKWLSNACGPVPFFLLLSGYGLEYTYYKSSLSFYQQLKRIFKLYVHYWIVLFVFLTVGFFLLPDRYPGSFLEILLNASGWESTYNSEMWFLFPYCLVSLSSPYIIRIIERIGNIRSLFFTGAIYFVVCFIISRYGALYLYDSMLKYQPILFLQFLYPFTLGVVFYLAGRKVEWSLSSWQAFLCASILVVIVATFGNSIAYMVYVPLLVFLLCQLSYPKWLEHVLIELGRKSMPIWMIHTWYCYYLFQPQIYSLRYPLVILGGVLLVSYLTAIPVMWVAKKSLVILHL